jgi:hypothetical protein
MIKNAKNAKTIFEKHGAEFLRVSRSTPARGLESGQLLRATPVGKCMASCRGGGKGPGIREAFGTYSYHCPTDGPQHHGRRRSLKT